MSIDARIAGIRVANGETILSLEPRNKYASAGQGQLVIDNPPNDPDLLNAMIGMEIWGNSSQIMHGNELWAKRNGYTHIELVDGGES